MKNEKWNCCICESEYSHDGSTEYSISDSGKNICEYCRDKVAVYIVNKSSVDSGKYYASAECKGYEIGTPFVPSPFIAKQLILQMIKSMGPIWGKVEKVEE